MPFKGWREKEEPAKETKNEQLLQCSEKKKIRMEYQMSSEEGVFKRQIIESNTQIG